MAWLWPKAVATSGTVKNVATTRLAVTPPSDPVVGPGQSLADFQDIIPHRPDGTPLGPATTATGLAPVPNIGTSVWVEIVDLAALLGFEMQNVSAHDLLYVYATAQPANGADLGIVLKAGANRFFAPPQDASYRGKVWGRAVTGTVTLRRNAW